MIINPCFVAEQISGGQMDLLCHMISTIVLRELDDPNYQNRTRVAFGLNGAIETFLLVERNPDGFPCE